MDDGVAVYSVIYLAFLLAEAVVLGLVQVYRVRCDPAPLQHSRLFKKYWLYTNGPRWLTLAIHLSANASCLLWGIQWGKPWRVRIPLNVAIVSKRAGVMACANLLPLFLSATRMNPVVWMAHLSRRSLRELHRVSAILVLAEAAVHAIGHLLLIAFADTDDSGAVQHELGMGTLVCTGFLRIQVKPIPSAMIKYSPVHRGSSPYFLSGCSPVR